MAVSFKAQKYLQKLNLAVQKKVGNIFDNTKLLEDKLVEMKKKCFQENSKMNRMAYNNVNAQLILHNKKEKAFWRQKSGLHWFKEGDVNSKFFHSMINSRRRRLYLKKIRWRENTWIEGNKEIATEAIHYFESHYSQEDTHGNSDIFSCLYNVINEEDNEFLGAPPTITEVEEAVFSFSADSAPRPDGISGRFYHH